MIPNPDPNVSRSYGIPGVGRGNRWTHLAGGATAYGASDSPHTAWPNNHEHGSLPAGVDGSPGSMSYATQEDKPNDRHGRHSQQPHGPVPNFGTGHMASVAVAADHDASHQHRALTSFNLADLPQMPSVSSLSDAHSYLARSTRPPDMAGIGGGNMGSTGPASGQSIQNSRHQAVSPHQRRQYINPVAPWTDSSGFTSQTGGEQSFLSGNTDQSMSFASDTQYQPHTAPPRFEEQGHHAAQAFRPPGSYLSSSSSSYEGDFSATPLMEATGLADSGHHPNTWSESSSYNSDMYKRLSSAADFSPSASHRLPLRGKRRSYGEEREAAAEGDVEAWDDIDDSHMSRQDKRRHQNKLAQRAFRARNKVQSAETSAQIANLVDINESQSRRLAAMAQLIANLQKENSDLRVAAEGSGIAGTHQATGAEFNQNAGAGEPG